MLVCVVSPAGNSVLILKFLSVSVTCGDNLKLKFPFLYLFKSRLNTECFILKAI